MIAWNPALFFSVNEYPLKTFWKGLEDVRKKFIQTEGRSEDLNQGKGNIESPALLADSF